MLTIEKVLNSNVVLVKDDAGRERVLLGKAIGYGKKQGAIVPADAPDQEFIALPGEEHRNLVDLLTKIDPKFITFTQQLVQLAYLRGIKLEPQIYLALTDHVSFAVQRARSGNTLVNRMASEVEALYPQHFALARIALTEINKLWNVDLPAVEAATIAFHLVNADPAQPADNALQVTDLIGNIVKIITHSSGIDFRSSSLHYARFLAHVQYFAERFFSNRMFEGQKSGLYQQLSKDAPESVNVAERVRSYMTQRFDSTVPDEEIAYLALHVHRAKMDQL